MRYLRTSGPGLHEALTGARAHLDLCWWYLGGNGFSIPREFAKRKEVGGLTKDEVREYWLLLIEEQVVNDDRLGRVGSPGFFSALGDSVDFSWTTLFAIEGREWPAEDLWSVSRQCRNYFGPYENLPPGVLLVARDIDNAYQEYCFRDPLMFDQVFRNLERRGYRPREVNDWTMPGKGY